MRRLVVAAVLLATSTAGADEPALRTASHHPMQYYLSLPRGHKPGKTYPVVVVVEAAEKQFLDNARRFVAARGDLPFIIVAPIIVTNGRQGRREPSIYPYSEVTWAAIDKMGDCAFDVDGLLDVLDDVAKTYGGERKAFLTGFEAGAHLVWAMTFLHPERLRAASPVAGNYIGRCVDAAAISRDATRATLPVRAFVAAEDPMFGPAGGNHAQFQAARDLAAAHGYGAVSETTVPGKEHVPLPAQVMAFFASLAK